MTHSIEINIQRLKAETTAVFNAVLAGDFSEATSHIQRLQKNERGNVVKQVALMLVAKERLMKLQRSLFLNNVERGLSDIGNDGDVVASFYNNQNNGIGIRFTIVKN